MADAAALQAAANALSAKLIRTRLDYWTLIVGPKFSKKDRQAVNLGRYYSLQQVEYCRNLIFRRNFPIHKPFERSCDMGLLRLSADRISQIFGWRLHQRLTGKLTSVRERTEHGHHVLRADAKHAVMRRYEKFSTFLRLEALSNNLKDFGLNKGLDNLDDVRRILRPSPTASPPLRRRRSMSTSSFLYSSASRCRSRAALLKFPASNFTTPA